MTGSACISILVNKFSFELSNSVMDIYGSRFEISSSQSKLINLSSSLQVMGSRVSYSVMEFGSVVLYHR